MARIAHGDIIVNDIIGAATDPKETEVTAVLSEVYRQVYTIMYPTKSFYTADDSKDEDALVDNDHVRGLLMSWLSEVINDYFKSGADGDSDRWINYEIPKAIIAKLKAWKRTYLMSTKSRIDNVRLWGSEIRDYHMVNR